MELTEEQRKDVIASMKYVVDKIYDLFAHLMQDPNDVYDLSGIKEVLETFKDTCEYIIDEKIIEKLS